MVGQPSDDHSGPHRLAPRPCSTEASMGAWLAQMDNLGACCCSASCKGQARPNGHSKSAAVQQEPQAQFAFKAPNALRWTVILRIPAQTCLKWQSDRGSEHHSAGRSKIAIGARSSASGYTFRRKRAENRVRSVIEHCLAHARLSAGCHSAVQRFRSQMRLRWKSGRDSAHSGAGAPGVAIVLRLWRRCVPNRNSSAI